MIQRIQTIYLLFVIALIAQVFFFPFLIFFNTTESISFDALQISNGEYVLPLSILFGTIILFALISIFLYKKRILQARITVVNIFLLLGSIGLVAYFGWEMRNTLSGYQIQYNFPCIFPPVAIIFNYLALRGIQKDEALVRSANRIR